MTKKVFPKEFSDAFFATISTVVAGDLDVLDTRIASLVAQIKKNFDWYDLNDSTRLFPQRVREWRMEAIEAYRAKPEHNPHLAAEYLRRHNLLDAQYAN